MHEAEVHVFSDSVVCLGKFASPKDGERISSTTKTPQQHLMENISITFHIFLGSNTNETLLNIDELNQQGHAEDGQQSEEGW